MHLFQIMWISDNSKPNLLHYLLWAMCPPLYIVRHKMHNRQKNSSIGNICSRPGLFSRWGHWPLGNIRDYVIWCQSYRCWSKTNCRILLAKRPTKYLLVLPSLASTPDQKSESHPGCSMVLNWLHFQCFSTCFVTNMPQVDMIMNGQTGF